MPALQATRLIHTGQVIVDLVMQVDTLPVPGGDVLAHHAGFEVGGGFNVMAAARRSGMRVAYPGGHGRGRFGDMARQAMQDEGIEIVGAVAEQSDTGLCVALVDASAERTFVTQMGAESAIDRSVLDSLAVHESDTVYVSGYSLLLPDKGALLVDWLEQLPAATCVAFDPGPLVHEIASDLLMRTLATTSIWTSNLAEAERFAQTHDYVTMFNKILGCLKQDAMALIRSGADGCRVLICDGTKTVQQNIHHVSGFKVDAIDSNGAGDAHAGVFLAVLADTTDPLTAARRANAAAAMAVTRRGPAMAPDAGEIDAFIDLHRGD